MVACGQTLKGDLWTNLGVWTVDKPWYLASVQVPVSGLWNSLRSQLVACGQALVLGPWISLGGQWTTMDLGSEWSSDEAE